MCFLRSKSHGIYGRKHQIHNKRVICENLSSCTITQNRALLTTTHAERCPPNGIPEEKVEVVAAELDLVIFYRRRGSDRRDLSFILCFISKAQLTHAFRVLSVMTTDVQWFSNRKWHTQKKKKTYKDASRTVFVRNVSFPTSLRGPRVSLHTYNKYAIVVLFPRRVKIRDIGTTLYNGKFGWKHKSIRVARYSRRRFGRREVFLSRFKSRYNRSALSTAKFRIFSAQDAYHIITRSSYTRIKTH